MDKATGTNVVCFRADCNYSFTRERKAKNRKRLRKSINSTIRRKGKEKCSH